MDRLKQRIEICHVECSACKILQVDNLHLTDHLIMALMDTLHNSLWAFEI